MRKYAKLCCCKTAKFHRIPLSYEEEGLECLVELVAVNKALVTWTCQVDLKFVNGRDCSQEIPSSCEVVGAEEFAQEGNPAYRLSLLVLIIRRYK